MPSTGSKNHHAGQCRPCKFLAKGNGCPRDAKCNFCHFEHHDEGKYLEIAWHAATKQLHPTQVLTVPAEEDHEMRCNRREAPCDEWSSNLWLGPHSESTAYSESDPLELAHGSEDLWQIPCGAPAAAASAPSSSAPIRTRSKPPTQYSETDPLQLALRSEDLWQMPCTRQDYLRKEATDAMCTTAARYGNKITHLKETWDVSGATCHELSSNLWLGFPSESTQYFESDPLELAHGSEDLLQMPCRGQDYLRKEAPDAMCTTAARYGNKITHLKETWDVSGAPCDELSSNFWLGFPSESTQYSESDPLQLAHRSEDLWQMPCRLQELWRVAPESIYTTSAQYGNKISNLEETCFVPEPEFKAGPPELGVI